MKLSELAAYAEEKYHMTEEHKWDSFPGFSVLADPDTGKWAALLMRQWDYESGTELVRCDIKCGRQCIAECGVPYVTDPFRMKGKNWVGVIFDEDAIVYNLRDWIMTNTPLNARGLYWNTFLTVNIQLCQDLTEKGAVLLLD